MSRLPRHGTAVRMGDRTGTVSQTGHPPWGVWIRVLWADTNTLSWHKAEELTVGE
jgi:hypothetical protein